MWTFLLWMSLSSLSPAQCGSDGACRGQEPPPGVLVVSPGHNLVLTCSGQVKVNGVKVNLTRKIPEVTNKRSSLNSTPSSQKITSSPVVSHLREKTTLKAAAGDGGLRNTDAAVTAPPDVVPTTRANTQFDGEAPWEDGEKGEESEFEDEDGEEGSRVTRGLRSRPWWSWNKSAVATGDEDWGEISVRRNGALLNLTSVTLTDSGKYACHYRGRERFSVKVIVADPPESPSLFCYKKSPSSKIRCEWAPRKPVAKRPHCYLLLSKSSTGRPNFRPFPCSYSSQRSRCWCALDYNDEEQRTLHMAYLCVASISGSARSKMLHFTPLDILKPDPPSNVSVQQEEGHQNRMKVSWNLPASWKQQDSHYALVYEVIYRPVKTRHENAQKMIIDGWCSYTITDAIPGAEYVIQVRAKDEYDGQWSEWSAPVYDRSWTAAVTVIDDLSATVQFDLTDLIEGSGSGADGELTVVAPEPSVGQHFVLWIPGVFALLSVILAAYIFRHKDRFLAKLNSLSVVTQLGEVPPPPPTVASVPEGHSLVTFDQPLHKEEEEEEADDEEEDNDKDDDDKDEEIQQGMETTHFNNTSYFLLQTT